eukprot:GSMAST32.ASY1.ANO1.1652.1 assembled CDS
MKRLLLSILLIALLCTTAEAGKKRRRKKATSLYEAAKNGYVGVVRQLLKAENINVNLASIDGVTPLYIASQYGHAGIVAQLITAGADVDKATNKGATPLYIASQNGHENVVEKLLALGADVDKAGRLGKTPLYIASEYGHPGVVAQLIAADADVDKTDLREFTPLHVASHNGHAGVVEQLITAEADVNRARAGFTPLMSAAREGHAGVVAQLIAAGANVHEARNGVTPLIFASASGNVEVVQLVLDAGADVHHADKNGATPLYAAASLKKGNVGVVQLLLDAGADVNHAAENGTTPLYIASKEGKDEVVVQLITAGADVNQADNDGITPLSIALAKGHEGVVKELLEAKADVNQANKDRETPLHIASWSGHAGEVVQLITAGADVNHANKTGATALYMASLNGHDKVIELLLKADNIDVNKADQDGDTPLIAASRNGHAVVLGLLIGAGAATDVNQPNKKGATPLYIASQENKAKAYVNFADNDGATPLYIASHNGHVGVIRQLLKAENINVNLASIDGVTPLYIASQYEADVNKTMKGEFTPLYVASEYGHVGVVRLLLDKGAGINHADHQGITPLYIASQNGRHADVNQATDDGCTPLHVASAHGYVGIVEELIAADAVVNQTTKSEVTPLFVASENGHDKVVTQLITAGADVNQVENTGGTPLFIASKYGRVGVVELLIKAGANVNTAKKYGETALLIASQNGHAGVVKLLIDAGADVNQAAAGEYTPLYVASHKGCAGVVGLLIGAGADVNQPNKKGVTPLYIASQENKVEVIKKLIEANACVNFADNFGSTPLLIASQKGHVGVVKSLLKSDDIDINQANEDGYTPLMIASAKGNGKIEKLLKLRGLQPLFDAFDKVGIPSARILSNKNPKLVQAFSELNTLNDIIEGTFTALENLCGSMDSMNVVAIKNENKKIWTSFMEAYETKPKYKDFTKLSKRLHNKFWKIIKINSWINKYESPGTQESKSGETLQSQKSKRAHPKQSLPISQKKEASKKDKNSGEKTQQLKPNTKQSFPKSQKKEASKKDKNSVEKTQQLKPNATEQQSLELMWQSVNDQLPNERFSWEQQKATVEAKEVKDSLSITLSNGIANDIPMQAMGGTASAARADDEHIDSAANAEHIDHKVQELYETTLGSPVAKIVKGNGGGGGGSTSLSRRQRKKKNKREMQRYKTILKNTRVEYRNPVAKWIETAGKTELKQFANIVQNIYYPNRNHKKILQGYKGEYGNFVIEARLDKAARVLFELRGKDDDGHVNPAVIHRVVLDHDDVPHYASQIAHNLSSPDMISMDAESKGAEEAKESKEVASDMKFRKNAGAVKRFFFEPNEDFEWLHQDKRAMDRYQQLEDTQNKLVQMNGYLAIQGRSGTGKSIVLLHRMLRWHYYQQGEVEANETKRVYTQVYIAKSKLLTDAIKNKVSPDECDAKYAKMKFLPLVVSKANPEFTTLLVYLENETKPLDHEPERVFSEDMRVDFILFKKWYDGEHGFKPIQRRSKLTFSALTVWTQIQSIIKGSLQAFKSGKPLTREEYLAYNGRKVPFKKEEREVIYAVYERSQKSYGLNKYDNGDRVLQLARRLNRKDTGWKSGIHPFDRVYVDEVQDLTPAELALIFMAVGENPKAVTVAGDVAQQVTAGVEFKFSDVLTVMNMHKINPAFRKQKETFRADAKILTENFRTHQGVLKLANYFINLLRKDFYLENALEEHSKNMGPPPATWVTTIEQLLVELGEKSSALLLFIDDTSKQAFRQSKAFQKLMEKKQQTILMFTVVEAKGLEWEHVVLVNFFSTPNMRWNTKHISKDPDTKHLLKLIYTGITRCQSRLFIVETNPFKGSHPALGKIKDSTQVYHQTCEAPKLALNQLQLNQFGMIKQGFMLVSMALNGEGDQYQFLSQAANAFALANREDLAERAIATNYCMNSSLAFRNEEKLVLFVSNCIKCGMYSKAKQEVVKWYSKNPLHIDYLKAIEEKIQ